MSFFDKDWINSELKSVSNGVIEHQKHDVKVIEPIIVTSHTHTNKHLKSEYFRDMISLDKHSKANYSEDAITKKHKKSSYIREFISDKA